MGEGGHRDDVSFNSNIRPKRSEDHDCDVPRARTERWAAHPEHVPAGLCSMTPSLCLCVLFLFPLPRTLGRQSPASKKAPTMMYNSDIHMLGPRIPNED